MAASPPRSEETRNTHGRIGHSRPRRSARRETSPRPRSAASAAGARALRRHLRLGPALLPAWRLRHRAHQGADGAGPRGGRHHRGRGRRACSGFAVGERIAISPSRPCGQCRYCQQGLQNHCLDMRYYGSAMRTPHVQGAFRQQHRVETSAGLQAGRSRQRRRRLDGRAAVGGAARGATAPARCSARACWSRAAGRSARWSSSPRGAPAPRTSSSPTWRRSRCAAR